LVGFYKPSDGFIRLDGADVSQWATNGLGKMIGYLPQDIQLFSGSISENISRLESVKDNDEAIVEAAKKVGIHDMILKMSNGYDTDIGEKGSKLSGGQRQRVGLARAIYKNPKYLVLDEPNSNMDGEAEIELIKLINVLKQEAVTVIVITHKPNLVDVADNVLVLHEGSVINYGPRKEVLDKIKLV
jgi:ABC-type protease/lipase transport system fused ATPase/permease subunit